jgi:hypothetical protein
MIQKLLTIYYIKSENPALLDAAATIFVNSGGKE